MRGETRAWATDAATLGDIPSQPLILALFEDAGIWAMVIRVDGLIEASTDVAAAMFAKPVAEVLGRYLADVLDPDVAAERMGFVRRALETASLVTVDSVMGGRLRRSYIRPLLASPASNGHAARVLVVCRPRPTDGSRAMIEAVHNDFGRLRGLTDREIAVLTLIAKGRTTSQIAKELHRSIKTIEWHRVSLGNKLGVKNRVELARFAISAGLAEVDSHA